MRLNNNISALTAYTNILQSNKKVSTSMAKLSSGYRINSPKDDASGIAISYKMNMQVTGTSAANRNSVDGISLVQTAEGAFQQIEDMVQRIRELSIQASNDTYDTGDREKMQVEIDELTKEIDNIYKNTEFNGISILNGSTNMRIDSKNIFVSRTSDFVVPGEYRFDMVINATQTEMTLDIAEFLTLDDSDKAGVIDINGDKIKISSSDTIDDVLSKIAAVANKAGFDTLTTPPSTIMTFTAREVGSKYTLAFESENTTLLSSLDLTVTRGTDAEIQLITDKDDPMSAFTNMAYYTADGDVITCKDINGQFFTFDVSVSAQLNLASYNSVTFSDTPLIIQTGANKDIEMAIRIPKTNTVSLGIDSIDCTSIKGAQKTIVDCDYAIGQIAKIRARLGAYQNRLEYTVQNLDIYEENLTASYSRIKDTDMALEMTNMTKGQVVEQVGMAILAQANQRPQALLQLM